MTMQDFNTAEANTAGDVIPDKTPARILLHVQLGNVGDDQALHRTKNGLHMLKLDAVVTEGPHAKRHFFPQFILGGDAQQLTEGQLKAVDISRKTLRAIIEGARGIAPTDESPAAMKARTLTSLRELEGMECDVIIGVEKGKDGYDDKNVIKRVVAVGAKKPATAPAAPATKKAAWA